MLEVVCDICGKQIKGIDTLALQENLETITIKYLSCKHCGAKYFIIAEDISTQQLRDSLEEKTKVLRIAQKNKNERNINSINNDIINIRKRLHNRIAFLNKKYADIIEQLPE